MRLRVAHGTLTAVLLVGCGATERTDQSAGVGPRHQAIPAFPGTPTDGDQHSDESTDGSGGATSDSTVPTPPDVLPLPTGGEATQPAVGAASGSGGRGPRDRVWATKGLAKIYELPNWKSPVIGAFRAGQSVEIRTIRTPVPITHGRPHQCSEGWYALKPRGFTCVGGPGYASFDANAPAVEASALALPDTSKVYPYHVGVSVGSPLYLRIPTVQEQQTAEPKLAEYQKNLPAPAAKNGGAIDKTPAGRGPSASLLRYFKTVSSVVHKKPAFEGLKISWSEQFDANGRTWLLTADMMLIPKDRVRVGPVPTLEGIDLQNRPGMQLPLAFLWLTDSPKFRQDKDKVTKLPDKWPRHSFVPATGKLARGTDGRYYWATRDGHLLQYRDATMIKPSRYRPKIIKAGAKWIQVRVTWGFLVAYEGKTPVYATAMSPGADGINKRPHATRRGRYFIGWKMLSADMSGLDGGKPWLVDEVPWVHYYQGNYAIHGAWWHNDFGRPRSHGCVNLPPADARFLFDWTEPVLPDGWYAVSSYFPVVPGTLVELIP